MEGGPKKKNDQCWYKHERKNVCFYAYSEYHARFHFYRVLAYVTNFQPIPIRFRKQRDCFGLASGTGVIVAESFVDDAFEVSLVVCFSSFIFSSVPTHPVVAFCCLSFFTLFQCTSSSGCGLAVSLPSDSPCVPAHPVVAWLSLFPQTRRVSSSSSCGLVVSLPSDSPCVAAHPVVAWLSLFPQTLRVLHLIQLWPGCLSALRLSVCCTSSSCGLVVSLPSGLSVCCTSSSCGLVVSLPSDSPCVALHPVVAWLSLFPQTLRVLHLIQLWPGCLSFPQTLRLFQLIQLWPGCLSALRLSVCCSSSTCGLVVSLPSDSPSVPAHPLVAWLSLFPQTLPVFQVIRLWLASLPPDSSSVLVHVPVACLSSLRTLPVF